ncbi:mechanosensitive ion channel family protein [Candidatus Mikella endobia]|uniref:mechanosensitive ion channel family protein n=1 Tax=Candidatus Mikella endobia TaxID=1778264 RepID=UPI000832EB24|nr:mechanosensitive ion channel domain-containing protein [Candidatus Mikella endobia]
MIKPEIRIFIKTLFIHIGYMLILLLILSILGIQWNNLSWIFSALTVGISFILQEIVKNYISGIILLIEKPIKIGDFISINGIEGDIRCINVRATEIQLEDQSIVIIPNYQLISQNVRNATINNIQGIVTIVLTFSLENNLEKVCLLLLEIYKKHKEIQITPIPFINLNQLTSSGIELSITGFVKNPRIVNSIKNELIFEILNMIRSNEFKLL